MPPYEGSTIIIPAGGSIVATVLLDVPSAATPYFYTAFSGTYEPPGDPCIIIDPPPGPMENPGPGPEVM